MGPTSEAVKVRMVAFVRKHPIAAYRVLTLRRPVEAASMP
jgi:hypothetical protein